MNTESEKTNVIHIGTVENGDTVHIDMTTGQHFVSKAPIFSEQSETEPSHGDNGTK